MSRFHRRFRTFSGPPQSRGFSLVEMMLALVAGLVVSAAALSFFFSSMKSNGEYVQSTRLTQELRNSLDLLTRDLRRAGYNDAYMALLGSGNSSPYSKILISGECIIYAYDRSGGTPGQLSQASGEIRGIRRKQVTFRNRLVGVIEFAASTNSVKPDCAGANADYSQFPPALNTATQWGTLSDPSILNITALTFTDSRVNANSELSLREIGVAVSGQLVGSTDFTRSISSTVRVRSDCFMPPPPAPAFDCAATP